MHWCQQEKKWWEKSKKKKIEIDKKKLHFFSKGNSKQQETERTSMSVQKLYISALFGSIGLTSWSWIGVNILKTWKEKTQNQRLMIAWTIYQILNMALSYQNNKYGASLTVMTVKQVLLAC